MAGCLRRLEDPLTHHATNPILLEEVGDIFGNQNSRAWVPRVSCGRTDGLPDLKKMGVASSNS